MDDEGGRGNQGENPAKDDQSQWLSSHDPGGLPGHNYADPFQAPREEEEREPHERRDDFRRPEQQEKRELVLPGEVVGEGVRAGTGTFAKDGKVYAAVLGIKQVREGVASVIALNGRYVPRRGDSVVGKVVDIGPTSWVLDLNSPYMAVLPSSETPWRMDYGEAAKFMNIGDTVIATIEDVDESKKVLASTRARGCRRLSGGVLLEVSAMRVPRIIGKNASMIGMIKELANCKVYVGKNGRIWIDGPTLNTSLAIEAIRKVESEVATTGLTDRIEAFLKGEASRLGIEPRPRGAEEDWEMGPQRQEGYDRDRGGGRDRGRGGGFRGGGRDRGRGGGGFRDRDRGGGGGGGGGYRDRDRGGGGGGGGGFRDRDRGGGGGGFRGRGGRGRGGGGYGRGGGGGGGRDRDRGGFRDGDRRDDRRDDRGGGGEPRPDDRGGGGERRDSDRDDRREGGRDDQGGDRRDRDGRDDGGGADRGSGQDRDRGRKKDESGSEGSQGRKDDFDDDEI
jgi:exosome complex component RRP4